MSTNTPEPRTEVKPEWSPLPPASPKPPRDPKRIALVAGGVTLAVILIATAVFALRGQSRPTTANTAAPHSSHRSDRHDRADGHHRADGDARTRNCPCRAGQRVFRRER